MLRQSSNISIGTVTLGPGQRIAVIAEGCDNHNGSLAKAKEMAHAARESGADIVKFQFHLPDEEMARKEIVSTSGRMFSAWGSLYGFVESNLLTADSHSELMAYCRTIGIQYLCTPFSLKAAELLRDMGTEGFKIGSGETDDLPFLEDAAAMGLPMIVSTGMSTWDEIALMVDAIQTAGAPLSLAHCISIYSPTETHQLQLGVLEELAARFGVPVGFSDHTTPEGVSAGDGSRVSQEAIIWAAIAKGACFVEKHFTLDRNQPDADSKFSLDPPLLKGLVSVVRAAEEAFGRTRRVFDEERPVWVWAKRSVVAARDIEPGMVIARHHLTSKRPGIGIRSKFYREVVGRQAGRRIKQGELLAWSDLA